MKKRPGYGFQHPAGGAPPSAHPATTTKQEADLNTNGTDRHGLSSQQVAWGTVCEHGAPTLEAVGSWPTAGTPEWVALPADDPAKLAALLDAARHWSLRLDSLQEASA